MDFPLIRTFEVSPLLTSFLNKKFDQYKKEEDGRYNPNSNFDQEKGYQSENLLDWGDKKFENFIDSELKKLVSNQLKLDESKFSYHWIHFLDYEKGGSMEYHNHAHNEDFVMFVYLKDCDGGETVFNLNNYDEDSFKRTQVSIRPSKDRAAIFSSLVYHCGKHTEEEKRIFVVGIKIDTSGKY